MPSKAQLLAIYGKKKDKQIDHTNGSNMDNVGSEREFTLMKQRNKTGHELNSGTEDDGVLVELSERERTMIGLDLDAKQQITKERSALVDRSKVKQAFEKQLKYEWGVGKTDRELLQKQRKEIEFIQAKKVINYEGSIEYNEVLKNKVRKGDPMARLSTQPDESDSEGSSEDGRAYRGPEAPPNRFDISPGYRWDGIDRSNGFERKYLSKKASLEATKRQRHLNAVANF